MKLFSHVIILVFTFIGCSRQDNNYERTLEKKTEQQLAITNIEDFDSFYKRFVNDDNFQRSRIKFPLKGYSFEGDEKVEWTKDNIKLQKRSVFDVDTSKYKIEVVKTNTTVFTRIYKDDSEVDIQNKFKLIKGEWYLTYHLNIY